MRRSQILTEILKDAKNPQFVKNSTLASLEWNRKKIASLFPKDKPYRITQVNTVASNYTLGELYLYQYSPKYKDKLPYYDKFPLCFIIENTRNGFWGLNMHYLRPTQRAQFMKALYKFEDYSKDTDAAIINVNKRILMASIALRYHIPCLKRYLLNHIITKPFYRVPRDEWNMTLFLPTQKFMKQNESVVWRDSAKMVKL
jgi:hypothetical protein